MTAAQFPHNALLSGVNGTLNLPVSSSRKGDRRMATLTRNGARLCELERCEGVAIGRFFIRLGNLPDGNYWGRNADLCQDCWNAAINVDRLEARREEAAA